MRLSLFCFLLFILTAITEGCAQPVRVGQQTAPASTICPGAWSVNQFLPLLRQKRVALLMNQTARVGNALLLDTLLKSQIQVVKVFVPEHGFRGSADAGASIANGKDEQTGIPIISLYGANKKPKQEQLADVDVVVYDLQDVGVRFYTYISTLQYAMEACAEAGKPIIVLDRPNPLGNIVDGPVLDTAFRSFVGMQPIPVVYGMTAGEYAQMLVGEKWFSNTNKLKLTVIPCTGYTHHSAYSLPVPPSPNLRTDAAIQLYPSLCLFEGTVVSVGRGTDKPFQQFGHPDFAGKTDYQFIPQSMTGASKPLLEGKACYGQLLATDAATARQLVGQQLQIQWLMQAYNWYSTKDSFFNNFFEKLAGTATLRKQIIAGTSEEDIRKSWEPGLSTFKAIRKKYLMYPE